MAYLALLCSRRKGDEHLGKRSPGEQRSGTSVGAEGEDLEDAVRCHGKAIDDSSKSGQRV